MLTSLSTTNGRKCRRRNNTKTRTPFVSHVMDLTVQPASRRLECFHQHHQGDRKREKKQATSRQETRELRPLVASEDQRTPCKLELTVQSAQPQSALPLFSKTLPRAMFSLPWCLEHQILNRWTEYCSELYNYKAYGDPSVLNCPQTDTEDDHLVLRREVEAAVQSLKEGKSAGVDNIPAELVQAGGEDVITALMTICNKIWQKGEWLGQPADLSMEACL